MDRLTAAHKMKIMALRITAFFICLIFPFSGLYSKEEEGVEKAPAVSNKRIKERCSQASAQADLSVNNVRTRILNGGDMWWDLVGSAKYEIPKIPLESNEVRKHALFAGSIWIGGLNNGNVVGAAQTYRQNGGNEFWPGPIDTARAVIDEEGCNYWDQIFQVSREEIDQFIEDFEETGGRASIPDNIKNWPGNGRKSSNESRFMAPYVNVGGGPGYDPTAGDYPDVSGDQALWYVYNDVGNLKTETGSPNLGLEFRTMAFAFATNDEVNNMTFYETTIFNRGSLQLDKTYFGQWVDPDLGYFNDDYVGCDVNRGLGFCYNGDNFDETAAGYGANPPSIGVDFFSGPAADLELVFDGKPADGIDNDGDGEVDEKDTTFFSYLRNMGYTEMPDVYEGDGLDNNRNGLVDEPNEDITMSKFVFYDNNRSNTGNPSRGNMVHFYNYLTGKWKNGDRITYGGNGAQGGDSTDFMFPGDPTDLSEWSELNANNVPSDRRFVQSAGPFTLKPGAVNKVTVGIVWARASSGGNTGSYKQLLIADDKAQKLFNNGFKILDGPNAPELKDVELDRELIFIMEPNDYLEAESYVGDEYTTDGKRLQYTFQGYRLFQLADAKVSLDQLSNSDLARQVWQSDVKDGITGLVNRVYDPVVEDNIPVLKVQGVDKGLEHVIHVTDDAFSSGNSKLINHKTYHYLLVTYAALGADQAGEDVQYIEGRRTTRVSGMPHQTEILFDGLLLNSAYGDGPEITRIEGLGNGGLVTELTAETVDTILAFGQDLTPTYSRAAGPVEIKVINPLKVPLADFELRFFDPSVEGSHEELISANIEIRQKQVLSRKDSVRLVEIDIQKERTVYDELGASIVLYKDSLQAISSKLNGDQLSHEDSIWYTAMARVVQGKVNELARDTAAIGKAISELNKDHDREDRKLQNAMSRLTDAEAKAEACVWELTKTDPNGVKEIVQSERPVYAENEAVIEEWGLSIKPKTTFGPLSEEENPTNGFVDATLTYESESTQWLDALPQRENSSDEFAYAYDWIRAGTNGAMESAPNPAVHDAIHSSLGPLDEKGVFKNVLEGMIAPYALTSRTTTDNRGFSTYGVSAGTGYGKECENFPNISGVDLVFTHERSLWTKVPIVEMGEETELTEGGAEKFHLRKHGSLKRDPGADGSPAYDESSQGYSWFPGYAINVETGERLNIILGENSSLNSPSSRDMIWNPTSQLEDRNKPISTAGGLMAGGMHYIYIMDAHSVYTIGNGNYETIYDEGKSYGQYLDPESSEYSSNRMRGVWAACSWVMPAMLKEGYELKSWKDGLVPTQTTISVRVNKPYQTYSTNENPKNKNLPFYTFNTRNIAPVIGENLGRAALKNVRVVPNPYYAQSAYEGSQLDNTVKITNLPKVCRVKIYTLNGQLVKSFNKSESDEQHRVEIIWNMKNDGGVGIASGVYIIHVDGGALGTTTAKLFVVMKPVDLDTF